MGAGALHSPLCMRMSEASWRTIKVQGELSGLLLPMSQTNSRKARSPSMQSLAETEPATFLHRAYRGFPGLLLAVLQVKDPWNKGKQMSVAMHIIAANAMKGGQVTYALWDPCVGQGVLEQGEADERGDARKDERGQARPPAHAQHAAPDERVAHRPVALPGQDVLIVPVQTQARDYSSGLCAAQEAASS